MIRRNTITAAQFVACAAAVLGLAVAGCGTQPHGAAGTTRPVGRPASTRASVAACQHAAHIWRAQKVVAAYQSTGGAVWQWKETRNKPPGARPGYPVDPPWLKQKALPIAVCYLRDVHGTFSGIPMAPGGKPYRQIIVLVDESTGTVSLDAASPWTSWPFRPPPAK